MKSLEIRWYFYRSMRNLKQLTAILILTYYFFGATCLPQGDFSVMAELPKMYNHCKATEDKDLTLFDFVTDHLMDVDCLFDSHQNGDDQKPHLPFQFHHLQMQTNVVTQLLKIDIIEPLIPQNNFPDYAARFYFTDYLFTVFHPPIV